MAAVRIEDKARTDWRFAALGKLCGRDRRWALGAMVDVWSHCTEEQTYSVKVAALDAIAEHDGFSRALVDAELGEDQGDGLVRIRGTLGRIEWLADKRAASAKGGAATRARWEATGGAYRPSDTGPNEGPLALALTTTTDQKNPERKRACARGLSPSTGDDAQTIPDVTEPPPSAATLHTARARVETALYVEWFNRTFGTKYEANRRAADKDGPLVQQVKWLLDDGYTQGDMRLVAILKKHDWQHDEKMQTQLRPSVLLRRRAFGERLDEARVKEPDAPAYAKLGASPLDERVRVCAEKRPDWWRAMMPRLARDLRTLGVQLPEPQLLALSGGRT